jgi:hypothetical protein
VTPDRASGSGRQASPIAPKFMNMVIADADRTRIRRVLSADVVRRGVKF